MSEGALSRYNKMRRFDVTSEPKGEVTESQGGNSFVIQKHDATRLHYDFRLELDGVMKSWAVPKGPCLSPKEKRLAVQTEDHPISYNAFEGVIPEGEYGGGPVIVWDRGTWTPEGDARDGLRKGRLSFTLDGEKIHGKFSLVRLRGDAKGKTNWLLMKRTDEHVREGKDAEITACLPRSVISGRTVEEVGAGKKAKAAKAAPTPALPRKRGRGTGSDRLPKFAAVEPQLATLVDAVPENPDFLYELKYDGYRALAWLERGEVTIASRKGLDWTARFPAIAKALAAQKLGNAIVDGEICYVLDDGRTDFQHLQNALQSTRAPAAEQGRLVYFLFDLLFLNGEDLRAQPLTLRKERLRHMLSRQKPPLKFSDHLAGEARVVLAQACQLGLEGLIAKRKDAPYRSGRGKDWLKLKCHQRQEFVIVGMTAPEGSRSGFGSLLLGLNENGKLRYAGKVGTGFSQRSLADLSGKLKARLTDKPAVEGVPRLRGVTWVRPELVCEVSFTEMTRDGVLRHPSFEGLREDKAPKEIGREKAVRPARAATQKAKPGEVVIGRVRISNPDRVMDRVSGVTKGDLARYHEAVAEHSFPYLRNRPLALVRCPQGDARQCFFQKQSVAGFTGSVLRKRVEGNEIIYVDALDALYELIQFNAVELHGWGSRMPAWERPDWIVFDLDPDIELPFARVVEAALEVKETLARLKLASFVKTTGGKGLHVVVPVRPQHDWDEVKAFARAIATGFAQRDPARYVATMTKKLRTGKIFVDYLRNAVQATAILPFSPRARPGATVALPVAWKDVAKIDPREFTVQTVPGLLGRRRKDPWEGLLATRQSLPRLK